MTKRKPKHFILFLRGSLAGEMFRLKEGTTVLGQDPKSDIVVNDKDVAKKHLKITVKGETVTVIDAGSKDGTTVNRKMIKKQTLVTGDGVGMGSDTYFKFSASDPIVDKAEEYISRLIYAEGYKDGLAARRKKRAKK